MPSSTNTTPHYIIPYPITITHSDKLTPSATGTQVPSELMNAQHFSVTLSPPMQGNDSSIAIKPNNPIHTSPHLLSSSPNTPLSTNNASPLPSKTLPPQEQEPCTSHPDQQLPPFTSTLSLPLSQPLLLGAPISPPPPFNLVPLPPPEHPLVHLPLNLLLFQQQVTTILDHNDLLMTFI